MNFWKTLNEKQKMLATEIDCFSVYVFNSIPLGSIKAMIVWFWVNSLLNNIMLDLSKLKGPNVKLNATLKVRLYIKQENRRKCWLPTILATLAIGQRPYVMACCASVRMLTFSLNIFYETTYRILIISQKCSCHGPLQNFLKELDSFKNCGYHGKKT